MTRCVISAIVWSALCLACAARETAAAEFVGRVIDAETGLPLPARVYLRDAAGTHLFVTTAAPDGSALAYREQWVPMAGSIEQHTTVSAHPFRIELPPGEYELEVERGKEYLPWKQRLVLTAQRREETIRLQRWIDLASRGWYSGETHVHRRLHELPNVMLAEDLNVAFPVTFWTVRSDQAPGLEPSPLRRQGPSPFGPREDRGYDPIHVDARHVIFPRNTEYEVFSVGDQRHVLGAIFLLNHRSVFTATAPPVAAIAEQAHAEGALLDLDKHSWPWSMMLVPVAKVDLFELSNNSVWRTNFGFKQASASLPPWATFEREGPNALTEWGWLNYGFEVYYALLNCGFRLQPTAGTASGVHPVPLGYSRVYVHTGDEFQPQRWLDGLRQGRSFVTTGPMLFATVNGKLPGESFAWELTTGKPQTVEVSIESVSEKPISAMEILVKGQVVESIQGIAAEQTPQGAWRSTVRREVPIADTAWLAVRSVEPQPDGRKRFAHTAPWHFTVGNRPMTPPREQVEFFIGLMEAELLRNREVLSAESLAEFKRALEIYRGLLP